MREINITMRNQSFYSVDIRNIYDKNDNNDNTFKKYIWRRNIFPLYTNKSGERTGFKILNEFKLNKENLENFIKVFITFDLDF